MKPSERHDVVGEIGDSYGHAALLLWRLLARILTETSASFFVSNLAADRRPGSSSK